MLLKLLILGYCIVSCMAALCPVQNHTVCNEDMGDEACVCAMGLSEESPPEKSCNLLINHIGNPNFPVVTIKFKLDENSNIHSVFPETRFKEEIGSSLKEDEDDIVILRQGCSVEEKQFIVQFVIKKDDLNEKDFLDAEGNKKRYEPDDFKEPTLIVNKMKVIGFLTQIADFDVDEILDKEELIDIEGNVDNSLLLIQGAVVSVVVVICCILGIWVAARKSNDEPEYSDNLQKV